MLRMLRFVADVVKEEALRAATVTRVGRQTGLLESARLGGIKALVRGRGKTNPQMVIRYHAGNTPHRTALVYRDRSWSYFELDEAITAAAGGLARAGVGRGDGVVLLLKNVPELVFAQQAIGRLGGAAVSASWRSTAAELCYLLENSGARAILFDAAVAGVVREVLPRFRGQLGDRAYAVRGEAPGFAAYDDLVAGAGPKDDPGGDMSDDASVVIYTSGTTGKPKGAVRKFSRDAVHQILGFVGETPIRVGQTHLTVCPLYHSTAFGFMGLAFTFGNTVVLLDHFEPETFLDALERHRVHHTAVVPTMLHRTLALGRDAIRRRDTSALEAIFTGGAPLSATLATEVMDAFGDKLFNFYGATETGFVTVATPADLRAAPGTIGRAVAGNQIRLLRDDGRLCGEDEVGELYVKSGNLVEGYHRNASATSESMKEGFFSVGDLARRDRRGYYFIEGRKRDMIISGGVNVYPREVEAALAAHPDVADAAVVGVPDDEWGERVCAFVELRPGRQPDEAALLAYCRQALAGPKRPREVHFLAALPRNPTGKVLKRELREELLAGG